MFELIEQAREALKLDNDNLASNLLAKAKSLNQIQQGLHYLQAIYFLKKGQLDLAREALLDELRYFPDNVEAKNLFTLIQPPDVTADALNVEVSKNNIKNQHKIIQNETKKVQKVSNRHLSIVHINTHDIAGGAAKVAWRLAEAQRNAGHNSRMLVGTKLSDSEYSYSFPIEADPSIYHVCQRTGQLFYEFQGSHKLINHPMVQSADILHLHNLHGGYFNPFSISALSHLKPVVWTLHDMQSFTGHCAHSFDCERWQTGCGECPYLNTEPALPVDTSAQLWKDKKLIYDHSYLSIVTPSDWLKKKVEKSILGNHPVTLIYNGIDTDVFRPYNKQEIKQSFGIPDNVFIIGAAAHGGIFDQWKGGQDTQAVLDILLRKYPNLIFLNIGGTLPNTNNRFINTGHIDDESVMAQFYSCLDIFIYTPIADNCPLTVLEALSCGVPLVTFDTGGIPELVHDGSEGFVIKNRDLHEMLQAVEHLIEDNDLRRRFSTSARERGVAIFDHKIIANSYQQLYSAILEQSKMIKKEVKLYPLSGLPDIVKTEEFLAAEKFKAQLMQKDSKTEDIKKLINSGKLDEADLALAIAINQNPESSELLNLQAELTTHQPKLSIVATARNDTHGGNLLHRMQIFLNGILVQSEKYQLKTELIIVEWNPPPDKPRLAQVLLWPEKHDFCSVRIIVVPPEIHKRFNYSEKLPLHQMIAKNVGIRRTHGQFILATNIDILFSDELFAFFASEKMRKKKLYRVTRYDVREDVPLNVPIDEQLSYCSQNIIRVNAKDSTFDLINREYRIINPPGLDFKRLILFLNACGDFQLMAREHWQDLRGYPELDIHPMHLDSILSYMAHFHGISEEVLMDPMRIYHIEHSDTHSHKDVWERLKSKNIRVFSNEELYALADKMAKENRPIIFNDDKWGLASDKLNETIILRAKWDKVPQLEQSSLKHERTTTGDTEKNRKTGEKYLSIVVTSRNDNHGGNLLHRMQIFVNGLISQCKKYNNLDAELIVVEWNPPPGEKRLSEAIEWPLSLAPLTVRFIEVPPEIHNSITNSDKIPLFQYIAKNAGMRRAKGEFILATNIDLLFSDELIWFLALKQLDLNCFYRTDRYDISIRKIPTDLSVEGQLDYCRQNVIRIYTIDGAKEVEKAKKNSQMVIRREVFLRQFQEDPSIFLEKGAPPHTSACGDFILMAKTKWHQFLGYPELGLNDLYIDGLIIYMAKAAGMEQVILKNPMQMFHINHQGSTSDHTNRIKRCTNLDYEKEYRPWCERMLIEGRPLNTNDENWGLAQKELKEYIISAKDNSIELATSYFDNFYEWITKLAKAEKRLYYRDQTPESLSALVELVHQFKPTKIVELGTLSGLSLRAWLSADSDAEIIAIDLSFEALHQSKQVLPIDLSRVKLLQQNILKMDFNQLWEPQDKVLLYVDAHDEPNVPIMEHVLQNALPALPAGSIVAVDDLWYSPVTLDNNNSFQFFENTVIPQFDPIIYRELNYAPYWEGGSFVGFPEVIPLLQWANQNAVHLNFKPGVKMVYFEQPLPYQQIDNTVFDLENFHRMTGVIKPKPIDGFVIYGENTTQAQQALQLCWLGIQSFEKDRYSEAYSYFEKSKKTYRAISGVSYAQAVCLARLGQFGAALNMLQEEIESPHPHPKAYELMKDIQAVVSPQQSEKEETKNSHKQTIAIFTIPKPFKGHIGIIQRNAIKSWTMLKPRPEIILFGDEEGIAEIAKELDLIHFPDIEKNEFGTPLVNSIFEKAQEIAKNNILVYINADIILMDDFMITLNRLPDNIISFLIIGRRWDLAVWEEINFSNPQWSEHLKNDATKKGLLHQSTGIDYFIFNKGLYKSIPPFAIGRPAWDNWLIWYSAVQGASIIDATKSITAIHQDHSYLHVDGGIKGMYSGTESKNNRTLAKGHIGTIEDAKYVLDKEGIQFKGNSDSLPEPSLTEYVTLKITQAREAKERGLYKDGLDLIDYAEAHLYDSPPPKGMLLLKAQLLLKIGKVDEAKNAAKEELKRYPDSLDAKDFLENISLKEPIDVLFEKGSKLLETGNIAEALAIFDKILSINPNIPDLQHTRAFFLALSEKGGKLLETGNTAEALAIFDKISRIYPNDADLQYARAVALFLLGRIDEAVSEIQAVLSIEPNHRGGLDLIAKINRVQQVQFAKHQEIPKVILTPREEIVPEQQASTILKSMPAFEVETKMTPVHDHSGKPLCFFFNTYYQAFLDNHYRNNSQLLSASYQEQKDSIQAEFFGDSDFYSEGVKKAGWNAEDLIINCSSLQQAWAKENNFSGDGLNIVIEQIRRAQPEVIYIQDMNSMPTEFLDAVSPYVKLIVGQIATPIFQQIPFDRYHVIFSSFPHYIERFRKSGLAAFYQPLAFDQRVLQTTYSYHQRPVACSFVGGISQLHLVSYDLLEMLAQQTPIEFWGYGAETLPQNSAICTRHHGEAWGKDMFKILSSSKITLNRHGEVAENYANNMRLFEATGCGALLITDYKDNLNELFEIGKEVVAYRTPEECVALVKYYISNPKEAEEIAHAGQARTLRDHTYTKRMEQTAEILERHLRYRRERNFYQMPDMSKISYGHKHIEKSDITEALTSAWKSDEIPVKQRALVQQELENMYKGNPPVVYQVLADCLRPYVFPGCSILEIVCASGYYCEILEYLLNMKFDYTGVDYSEPLISMAKDYYPKASFFIADGANLFFEDRQFYIVISSCILLHTPNYREHIFETARVAENFVVAHRTPVCRSRATQYMKKFAYGIETVELIFNEEEIVKEFGLNQLQLIDTKEYFSNPDTDEYNVTYLFKKL